MDKKIRLPFCLTLCFELNRIKDKSKKVHVNQTVIQSMCEQEGIKGIMFFCSTSAYVTVMIRKRRIARRDKEKEIEEEKEQEKEQEQEDERINRRINNAQVKKRTGRKNK